MKDSFARRFAYEVFANVRFIKYGIKNPKSLKCKNMLSPLTLEFLTIIINNNHSNDLLNIISKFNHLSEHHLGVINVDIITATKLSDEELNSLSQKIDGILNNSPSVNNITDPNIIGGMKLRVGNNIFDNSVSYQINQLKKTLHNM